MVFFMMLIVGKTRKGDCMMEIILQENSISFKEFEKKIFQFGCDLGQEIAKTMLEYIEMYARNTENPNKTDKKSKKSRKLYKYLSNNKAGLLPYQKRGIEIPCAPKGMKCRG